MIQLPLTPAQFAKLRDGISHATGKGNVVAAFTEDSPTTGSLRTSKVALSYSYDGSAQLNIAIDQKFGMAKLDSDADIGKRIGAMLAKL
jgi:hypothetical protein